VNNRQVALTTILIQLNSDDIVFDMFVISILNSNFKYQLMADPAPPGKNLAPMYDRHLGF
jgi:hypothetical protein